ncbi:hypothetical protein P3S67_028796 [Capsicum chacoense]
MICWQQVVVRADGFPVPPSQYEALSGEQPEGGKSGEEGKLLKLLKSSKARTFPP